MAENMASASKLFTPEQQAQIVAAIQSAERCSSAEIRVHIENHCKGDVLDRAVDVFAELKMNQTELRNGVLIYVAVKDRKTAIIGDVNINKCVKRDFWQQCYAAMKECFAASDFTSGICSAIGLLETELQGHFPYQSDDVNELSDEISFGK